MSKKLQFLVQEREGQEPFIYAWTPVLAKKKDMRPVSVKEAKQIMEEQKQKMDNVKAERIAHFQELMDEDDENDNEILSELDSDSPKTSPIDGEARPLEVKQEDILEREIVKINKLRKKAKIEEYILKKYKIPLIPMEEVDEMKQQAMELLTQLANSESLFE